MLQRIASYCSANYFRFFLLTWLGIMLVYLPAYKAGMVGEFINYLNNFRTQSFLEFINAKDAQVKSFYQLANTILYLKLAFFGSSPIPWFLSHTASHSVVLVLVFSFFKNLFEDFKLENAGIIALCGSLLFGLNPNISELTIWKATEHYFVSIILQFLSLHLLRQYLAFPTRKFAILSASCFFLSIFALEIFYLIPIFSFAIIVGYYWKSIIDKVHFRKAIQYILLPQIILFFGYLVCFRMIHGSWIAHYGTTADFVWSLSDMVSSFGKYIGYLGVMLGHFPYDIRSVIYALISKPVVHFSIIGFVLFYLIFSIIRFRKMDTNAQLILFAIGAFVCSIGLCVTVYFDDLFSMYNSRRCYHSGIFFYMAITLFIFRIKPKKHAIAVFSLYFLVCISLTEWIVFRWRHAAKIQFGILRTFTSQQNKKTILLNVPTYFKDVRINSADEENEFAKQLDYFGYSKIEGKLYSAMGYNMNEKWHGAHVSAEDSLTVKVTLNQWGSWWMRGYQGAKDYENDLYKIHISDMGHEYFLTFKQVPDSNTVLLFQQDEQWRKVDMNKRGEQW